MKTLTLTLIFLNTLIAQSVTVAHNDLKQSGANTSETRLTTANVATGTFGKLCSASITGAVYAQSLYLPAVTISGTAHDTAFVATMANNLYAIDVHSCAILWTKNFGTTWTNYGTCCSGNLVLYGNPMGILGTPVIDPIALKLYVVNATPTPSHILNRIDLTTGNIEASRTIAGSVAGAGGPSDNCAAAGVLTFCSVDNQQGIALVLSPDASKVYIGFNAWENGTPGEHGWLFAYNTASTMTQAGIFCTTPNGNLSSIWMSRGGPSVDGSGNVYVMTGNGDFDGVTSFGECVLKLSPTLTLLGFFVNPNGGSDTSIDADFGSNRFLLIPGTTLGVGAGKDFSVYVIDTTGMTQVQTFKTNQVTSPAVFTGSFGGLFMNNTLYLPTTTGPLYAFAFSAGTFNTTPLYVTGATLGSHNGQLAGSSNGGANQILWQVTSATSSFTSNPQGTVRALNASTGAEIWNSGSTLGLISKFVAPTVTAGLVMVPSNSGTFNVFGVLPTAQLRGSGKLRGTGVLR
jgi:hypothetical protein